MMRKIFILFVVSLISLLINGSCEKNRGKDSLPRMTKTNIAYQWYDNGNTLLLASRNDESKLVSICSYDATDEKRIKCLVEMDDSNHDLYVSTMGIRENWLYILAGFADCSSVFKVSISGWRNANYKIKKSSDLVSVNPGISECYHDLAIANDRYCYAIGDMPSSIVCQQNNKITDKIENASTPRVAGDYIYFRDDFFMEKKEERIWRKKWNEERENGLGNTTDKQYLMSVSEKGYVVFLKYKDSQYLGYYIYDSMSKSERRLIVEDEALGNVEKVGISPDGAKIIVVYKMVPEGELDAHWSAKLFELQN